MSEEMKNFKLLSVEFQNSMENDKPKQYSLKKLIQAAKNKTIVYDDEISAMYAKLGFMTTPTVSSTLPWLTYINSIIIAYLVFRIIPFHKFKIAKIVTAIAAATKASVIYSPPTSPQPPPIATQLSTEIALWLDVATVIALLLVIILLCCYLWRKIRHANKTMFEITFFAGSDEISLDLGRSAYKVDEDSELQNHQN
jgi:hypothetical protein